MHSSLGVKQSKVVLPPAEIKVNLLEVAAKRGAAARFRGRVATLEVVIDLIMVTFAVTLGYLAYYNLDIGKHVQYQMGGVFGVAFGFAIVVVLMLDRVGAYKRGNGLLRIRETEQVLRVSTQAFFIAFAVSFFTSVLVSRWLLVICFTLVPLALFIEKHLVYIVVRNLYSRGYGVEKVIIYGSGSTGRRVFSALSRSPKLGLEPMAFVDDDIRQAGKVIFEMGYERRRSAPVVCGPVSRDLIAQYGADVVIVAIPLISYEKFLHTTGEAVAANARISFVPSHFIPSDSVVDYDDVDGVLLASFGRFSKRLGYDLAKRVGDVLGSLVLLALGSPIFLLLALLTKLDSPGPIFFKQERIGYRGKSFCMYKFRTMHCDAPAYGYSPNTSSDPRITGFGRFLRRTSLDELPQLLNVLQGSMSLVGPRPEMPFIVEQYTDSHRQRLEVKPGLTGLWQLSGDRAFLIHENVEYDLYYIQHQNFFMDVAILLHTLVFAMRGV